MSWDAERQDSAGFAGDFRAARSRIESPLSWSLPLVRLGSVAVRVHGVFLLFIAVECLRASLPGTGRTLGFGPTLVVLAAFVLLSALHEAIRWTAMRRAGFDLDEWLLWPLGGLTGPGASDRGAPGPWLELSGWGALAALWGALGTLLWWRLGGAVDAAFPVPWNLDGFTRISLDGASPLDEALALVQWTLSVMLALNLVPAFPLAAGRALAARWIALRGWSAGLARAARLGTACAVALFIVGLGFATWTITLLALLLWAASRETIVRVADADGAYEPATAAHEEPRVDPAEQAELDRILEKINRHGMDSLNFLERRRLKAATRRRREGGGPIR